MGTVELVMELSSRWDGIACGKPQSLQEEKNVLKIQKLFL